MFCMEIHGQLEWRTVTTTYHNQHVPFLSHLNSEDVILWRKLQQESLCGMSIVNICNVYLCLSYCISVRSERKLELIPFTYHLLHGFFERVLLISRCSNLFQPRT